MVFHISAAFEEDVGEELREVKGDRSWEDAICEEFGVDRHGDEDDGEEDEGE